jgi:hypothetical protein
VARRRKFVAAGINISLQQPHTPDRYIALLEAIFDLKHPIRVRGDQHIMISSVFEPDQNSNFIEGSLARFTEIDPAQPWFDLEQLDRADDSDRREIRIPDRLRPNYQGFYFYFDLSSHTFAFQQSSGAQSLSIRSVQRFLIESTRQESIVEKFGTVSVSIIQADDALDQILGLRKIKRLRIVYNLPNPDDHASLEAHMAAKFQAVRATKFDIVLEGDSRTGINPSDPEVRQLASSALRNGFVEAKGYNAANQLITASSEEHPKTSTESFDPEAESERNVLRHAARRLTPRAQ